MNNQIIIVLISIFFSIQIGANNNPNWGVTAHRTVGLIAEKYLAKKTKKQIDKILKGESLAFVSTYGDEIKSDKKYNDFYNWHYINFPFNTKYKDAKKNPKGDIVTGINYCIKVLKNETSSEADKVFYLKFLVHLIGDLHQPLHVGRGEDKGGNDIKVKWHNKKSNLHRVWDSDMIEYWNMSYTELASNAKHLSSKQIESLQQGSILNWTYESQKLAMQVYKSVKVDQKLSYKYSYKNFTTVRTQLQKAGVRLAKILNDIYN